MTEKFVPAFNHDGELTSQEEMDALLEAADAPKGGKVFRPGDHLVTVKEVILPIKANGGDKGWMSVRIVFSGTGNESQKVSSIFQLVPLTNRLSYTKPDGSTSGYPLKSYFELMQNLGIDISRNNVNAITLQYFTEKNLGALVGREVTATIGYKGAHTKWVSTGEKEGYVAIEDRGELLKNSAGDVLQFNGDDAYKDAEAYCNKNGIKFEAFPEIIGMAPTAANTGDSVVGGDF